MEFLLISSVLFLSFVSGISLSAGLLAQRRMSHKH